MYTKIQACRCIQLCTWKIYNTKLNICNLWGGVKSHLNSSPKVPMKWPYYWNNCPPAMNSFLGQQLVWRFRIQQNRLSNKKLVGLPKGHRIKLLYSANLRFQAKLFPWVTVIATPPISMGLKGFLGTTKDLPSYNLETWFNSPFLLLRRSYSATAQRKTKLFEWVKLYLNNLFKLFRVTCCRWFCEKNYTQNAGRPENLNNDGLEREAANIICF